MRSRVASALQTRCECFANALDIPLPLRSQGKFVNMINERFQLASHDLSILKGN
ncbi:hypothetical protein [Cylindrospermopsis raciborskii]|uniref:hypothetical protein n=1 Tax=Cylindrospermopsis raciborskii TaxID=77022 RepID=UPI001454DC02|nr:hypothetical protein [Cylindrospermopsis raciborskii]